MIPRQLQDLRHDERFLGSPAPTCILDEQFVVRAANRAYTRMTGVGEDDLLSRELFEVFPGNTHDPESDGHVQIRLSGEKVMREKRGHHLLLQRYDLPDRAREGAFVPRYWVPVNRPFLVDGQVRGVINRVDPAPLPEAQTARALRAIREAVGDALLLDEPADEERLEAFGAAVATLTNLGREVSQLREALVSRSTIEQAKGLLMGEHGCTPDEAFRMLVRLSNDTNVRVAEVAAALVYRAQRESGRVSGS